jgi:hypothetical protein
VADGTNTLAEKDGQAPDGYGRGDNSSMGSKADSESRPMTTGVTEEGDEKIGHDERNANDQATWEQLLNMHLVLEQFGH